MRKTIMSEDKGFKGGFSLYVEGEEVIFDYHCLFDANTDEWIDTGGAFPIDNYKNGIKELKEKGNCSIEGYYCSMNLMKTGDKMELQFTNKRYRDGITIVGLNWAVDDCY